MDLAERLGLTLGRLLDEMTSAELMLWFAKARLEHEATRQAKLNEQLNAAMAEQKAARRHHR